MVYLLRVLVARLLGGDSIRGYDGRYGRQGEKIVQVVLWWLC